ncbi:DamX protein [Citrobacter koseri]|uniref:DamX protein n=1 Tax=Citrobacter koseri TaxID=545 RepID=A0A2X2WHD6_CITKO|nr:DamX protein [Citrobacter koseri]
MEVQGDLNNALTQPQGQEQVNNVVANSTLPTEPATVAPIRNGNAPRQTATTQSGERQATTRPERKQVVIEPKKPQTTAKATPAEPKPTTQPKRSEPAAPVATTKAPATSAPAATTAPKATASTAPAQTAAPAQTTAAAGSAAGTKSTGNVGSLKSAPSSHYTLQLSSSSNYDNLNGWAKKENLKNYVVYQTTRNGQPWVCSGNGLCMRLKMMPNVRCLRCQPMCRAKNPWGKTVASGAGRSEVIVMLKRRMLSELSPQPEKV